MEQRFHSRGLRIWHWADGLVVIALISTFFLRDFLVDHSRDLVAKLRESGVAVTDEAARPFLKQMVQDLWKWHIYLGYILTALLLWRVVLIFTDKRNPFVDCWKAVCGLKPAMDFRALHGAGVKAAYLAFYLLQLFMVLSGLAMVFSESLGLSKDFRHLINEGHEAVMWFFLTFVILHVIGVFVAENRDEPGIVSAMINGSTERRPN